MNKCLTVCILIVFLTGGLVACGSSSETINQGPAGEGSALQSEIAAKHADASQDESLAEKNSAPYAVDLQVVEIPAPSLSNNLINEPNIRKISVLLPHSYYENQDVYPVLYFLSGYGGTHDQNARGFRDAMTALSMEDLIIVCIDAVNRLECSYYVNSPVTGNWQDFVTKDVVGYIDSNYRTIPKASGRGISGHSIGGFGTMNIVVNTEGIFSHAYAMSPAVFAPKGLVTYGLQFDPVSQRIAEYQNLSEQEARERYLRMIGDSSWNIRYAFNYGSAFAYDENAKAPYIRLPERVGTGEYLQDAVWEQHQNGLGGPTQRLAESRERILKLDGLVVDYGNQDELTWVLDGCNYLAQQLVKQEILFDLRVYDGGHSSEVAKRIISDVLPYFADNLGTGE